ncbi:MAG: LamG-like jellyroll fold domain-containing protein, partial [Nanoarchaeota archaeon]
MDKITIFNKREPRVYLNPKELQDPPTYESLDDEAIFDLSHYYKLLVLKLILIISSVRFIMVNSYLKISCLISDILKPFRLLSSMIRFKFTNLFDNFKVLIENKSGGLKRTFFTLTMIIMVYFLFFSVLPGNERILPFVCAVNECTGSDGDPSTALCTAYGTCGGGPAWSIGGETAPTACCGDDASENKRTAAAAADSTYTTNAADDGCCTASTDCIQSSTCTDTAGTSAGNYCNAGTWQGGDDSSTACVGLGKTWLADGLLTNSKCCGEDSGEDFEQTAGAGRSACYNNAVLADGSATVSLLASNGDLYDCGGIASDDSGLGTHISTGSCTSYEGLYCQTNNVWTSTLPNTCACTTNSQCTSSYCDEETGSGLGNDTLVCYAITTCPGGASRCSGYDNTCQVDAGADAVCDDRLPNTCITGGYCDSNCLFKTLNATSGENVTILEESTNSGTATLKQRFTINSNGQDTFKIFRKKGDKDSFINVANTTTSEYNDTTVEPNQLYYYYVQPVESTINCGGSVSQTIYNISQNTVPPTALTIVVVNTSTFVNLSWNDADPGLELYIPMDDIVGTTVKEWGKNKKKGDSSGASQTTGKYGKGLNFDGNDYLTMTGEAANYSYDQFTVMTWIKRTTDTGLAEIIIDNRDADNDGWLLFVDSNDKLQAQYNTFDAISSDTIPIDTWTHVAAVVNSTNIELYVGGILKNTTTKSGSISETANAVIGARSFTSPTNYFNGIIDEVRLYNTSLTQGGVIRDMQAGLITKKISKAINSTANGFVDVGYFNDTNFTDTSATDVAPPNDAAPVSTTHTVGSWSNNPNVTFTWTAPSDNSTVYYYNLTSIDAAANTNSTIINTSVGTGLDGFALNCNQASAPINRTTKDIEETTTTYTCSFPEGANNYFHIRTVDIAGNWYPTNNDTGPWGIDTLIPDCSFQNLTVNTTYGYISTNIIYYNNASIGN